ncbi:MAG: GNAT family N-acetyltransferase [Oscillospiraceae bacterium]|nr:GNAT family N-acetyltransferase [Oscillospiraceae bacterium]
MDITIKQMETEEEIRGKAYVYWRCWHDTYPGLVSQEYLDKLTPEVCEKLAFDWPDGILIAKEGDRVVGFVGYGEQSRELPDCGEIFALYVLKEERRKGIGRRLLNAALERLDGRERVCLWVVKGNVPAIRFYQKHGFQPDGAEKLAASVGAFGIQMIFDRSADLSGAGRLSG